MVMLVVYVLIMVVFGVIGATLAESRNREPVVWGIICALFPLLGILILLALGSQSTLLNHSSTINASTAQHDAHKWETLKQVDPEIAAAAAKANAVDAEAEKLLAKKYLTLNDKSYLDTMVKKAIEESKNIVNKGEISGSKFVRNSSGKYVIISGKNTGAMFETHEDLMKYLKS